LLVVFERFFCGSEWVETLYGSKAVKPGIRFVYKWDQPLSMVKVNLWSNILLVMKLD
jgi:hypothetical protein